MSTGEHDEGLYQVEFCKSWKDIGHDDQVLLGLGFYLYLEPYLGTHNL